MQKMGGNNGSNLAIRLLHIFPTFGVGGQQVRLVTLMREMGEQFSHRIISLNDDISAIALLEGHQRSSVSVLKVPKSGFISGEAIRRLQQRISNEQSDILCTYNWGAIEAIVANKLKNQIPHLHFEDGFGPDEGLNQQNWKRVLVRRLLLRRSRVVVPSKGLQALALNHWQLPQKVVRYIPNGIATERFSLPRNENQSDLVIGSVGTIRPEKNFGRLIRAFKASGLSEAGALKIFGDGPDLDDLVAQTTSMRGITFPGQINTPETAYAGFDIFAMSSDTEQMPLSLMEAMASGLPVIATDVGDIANMVSQENRRFVTPVDDEEALAASLIALGTNPALRKQLGQANREKANNEFRLDQMVKAHKALYQSVL